jgi:hypothetical protein
MRYLVVKIDTEYSEFVTTGKKRSFYSTNFILEESRSFGSFDEAVNYTYTYADYELSMPTDPIIVKHKTLKGVHGVIGFWQESYFPGDTDSKKLPLEEQYIVNLIIEETSHWFNCAPADNTPLGEIFTSISAPVNSDHLYTSYADIIEKVFLDKTNYNIPRK